MMKQAKAVGTETQREREKERRINERLTYNEIDASDDNDINVDAIWERHVNSTLFDAIIQIVCIYMESGDEAYIAHRTPNTQRPFIVAIHILKYQPKMIILLLVVPLSSICVHPTLILSGFHGSKCYSKLCKLKSCLTHFICKTSARDTVQHISTSRAYWFFGHEPHSSLSLSQSLSSHLLLCVLLSSSPFTHSFCVRAPSHRYECTLLEKLQIKSAIIRKVDHSKWFFGCSE